MNYAPVCDVNNNPENPVVGTRSFGNNPEQVARLVRQRGWTEEEARRRLNVQRTNEDFRAAADVALENRGTPADLERDARAALERLRASRGAGAC